jgi:hypothetical protein
MPYATSGSNRRRRTRRRTLSGGEIEVPKKKNLSLIRH